MGTQENSNQNLTAQELKVINLMAEGMSNKEMADKLILSLFTIKTHVQNIFAKTGIHKRTQLVAYAIRNNLLDNKPNTTNNNNSTAQE